MRRSCGASLKLDVCHPQHSSKTMADRGIGNHSECTWKDSINRTICNVIHYHWRAFCSRPTLPTHLLTTALQSCGVTAGLLRHPLPPSTHRSDECSMLLPLFCHSVRALLAPPVRGVECMHALGSTQLHTAGVASALRATAGSAGQPLNERGARQPAPLEQVSSRTSSQRDLLRPLPLPPRTAEKMSLQTLSGPTVLQAGERRLLNMHAVLHTAQSQPDEQNTAAAAQ